MRAAAAQRVAAHSLPKMLCREKRRASIPVPLRGGDVTCVILLSKSEAWQIFDGKRKKTKEWVRALSKNTER